MSDLLPDRRRLRRGRIATSLAFLLFGAALGVWTARLPAVKERLGLSDGRLTFVLLSFAAGCLLGLAVLGRLSDRFGSSRLLVVAAALEGTLLAVAGFNATLVGLCVTVFGFGAVHGTLNIAMNANAVEVQRAWGSPIMSSFHAIYSIGGFAGALIGGQFARHAVGIGPTFLITGAGVLALTGWAALWVLPSRPVSREPSVETAADRAGRRSLLVVFCGVLVLFTLVGEGAAADWSAVYLRDNLHTTPGFAAYGYAAFAIMMTVGRIFGDRLVTALGPVMLVRAGGLLAAAGLGVALLVDRPVAGVIGFGLLGLGLSGIAPQVFSAVGSRDAQRSGRDLSTVVSIGYVGFLVGPILIGAAATVVGLPVALWIPVVLAVVVAASGSVMRVDAGRPSQSIRSGRP
ncbi:putative MFS family arabinose efflux permease [Actinoplanes octamycinicus]|uniref:Putative MFS family arabinose efflux permease n=1 Tax=Actinoplanes octamycinicus TaxID=135948 RepID=A0A7W7H3E5_9ACTN|nr:MFS transporter [Actinoplanes octamycinicus]MBB4743286.1 putative MFS family arabinose efflux permease [Actinoplanes octamycinicus]GIE61799.1 MFS transporter [Actinoplanes octamycinicus]